MNEPTDGRRLLVLGAGLYQLAGIRRAVELGCEVVTVDNVPTNPGHRLAARSVDASTTDVAAVCAIAADLDIDGVVTFASDVATTAVAAVRARFDPEATPASVVEQATSKSSFRRFQSEAGLPCPRHLPVTASDPADEVASRISSSWRWPVVAKPIDSSGSRGVTVVTRPADLGPAVETARSASRSGQVVVEEFVDGVEVGGDLFLRDGQMVAGAVTNKHLRGPVVIGHSLPSTHSPHVQGAALRAVVDACGALGISDGPINFDVMLPPDGPPVVLELSPRTGGNGIPEMIRHATGFDEYAATIRFALGEGPSVDDHGPAAGPCGSVVFGSGSAGVLTTIAQPDELSERGRRVLAMWNRYPVGSAVPAFDDGGGSMGYVVFTSTPDDRYDDLADDVRSRLNIRVRPPDHPTETT